MGIINVLAKLAGTQELDEGGEATVNQLFDFTINYRKLIADGSPSAATPDLLIWTNPFDCNVAVVGGRITAIGAGVAADATNYAKIAIKTDDGLGGTPVEALAFTTQPIDGGPLASLVSKLFTKRTPSGAVLVPGASLYLDISKVGSGVGIPMALIVLRLRKQS